MRKGVLSAEKKANISPGPLRSQAVVREPGTQPSALFGMALHICALLFDEPLSTFLPISRSFLL